MSKATKNKKQALVPRLRFPEFRDAGQWDSDLVKNLVTTVTPPKKLTSDQYEDEGNFPVIDQSQEYICGWTNDEHALVSEKEPLIVFGDHTCALKIIDQPFVQGADGIKILKAKNVIEPIFLYQYLLFYPVKMESYKRHFSTLKEKLVLFPEKKTGEQQKIVDCLSSLDALIAAQAEKIDALKTHKKGLMQQLFPREGETVPRLRFPEFRDAGEWVESLLDDVCDMQSGKFIAAAEISSNFEEGMFPCFGGNGLRGYTNTYNQSGRHSLIGRQGALCGNVNFVDGDFYATEHAVVTTPKPGISADWLFYNLTLLNLNRFATGQAQPGLSVEVLDKVPCAVPRDENEQQRIANCLSSLDDFIAAQTERLDALKNHKKGLMQQLFPSPEAMGA